MKCHVFRRPNTSATALIGDGRAMQAHRIVHGVGGKYVKQGLLLDAVAVPEHDVVTERPVDVQVYLPDVRRHLP